MSKKRAFVRYTKSGEIVPGSLIITTNGGYPDKSSLWKEVTTNECCDGGGCDLPPIPLSTVATGFPYSLPDGRTPYVKFKCNDVTVWEIKNVPLMALEGTLQDYIGVVNLNYPWIGTWLVTGTDVVLQINGGLAKALCPEGLLTIEVGVFVTP